MSGWVGRILGADAFVPWSLRGDGRRCCFKVRMVGT